MSHKELCVVLGAGPGMGLAIARRFGREGFRVALMARRAEALSDLVSELEGEGIEAQGISVDVSDSDSVTQAFQTLRADLGEPDVLVYNAAMAPPATPDKLAPELLATSLQVNVLGALRAVQEVLPAMRDRDSGTILLTGGGLALYPNQHMTALSIGKAAIRSLAFCLAKDLEGTNLRAHTITICGFVKPGAHFDPENIAESFWTAHAGPHQQGPELRYE